MVDALRFEKTSGKSMRGRHHLQNSQEYTHNLEKWLEINSTARSGNRAAAESVLNEAL